jgi:capsule biosynthesis phosphatase
MADQKDKEEGTLVVDIDGTLCPIKTSKESYADLVPYPDMIEKLREYKNKGYKIVLFTSRNMKTYNANLGQINKYTAPVLLAWLEKWNIPFDEIHYGKPWPQHKGFYIDDRTVRPDEFLKMSETEIHALLGER